jgi:hypothetical protein
LFIVIKRFTAIALVIIAATAAFALTPLVASIAMAKEKTTTSTTCVHNGNLRTVSCPLLEVVHSSSPPLVQDMAIRYSAVPPR